MICSALKPCVLLVDDNSLNLTLLMGVLSMLGCEVVPLSDGSQVSNMVRQRQPAVILMDIRMPGVSGFEVVRELKAASDTRDIPVYALTSMTPEKFADNTDSALFSGLLRKPPSANMLKTLLVNLGIIADPDQAAQTLPQGEMAQTSSLSPCGRGPG